MEEIPTEAAGTVLDMDRKLFGLGIARALIGKCKQYVLVC